MPLKIGQIPKHKLINITMQLGISYEMCKDDLLIVYAPHVCRYERCDAVCDVGRPHEWSYVYIQQRKHTLYNGYL